MTDPILIASVAASLLVAVGIAAWAGLRAWHEWLELKHMELVSRKIILPYLEQGEEGIGFRVEVDHLASALPGMRVDVDATFVRQERNRVHVACRAHSELGDLIGEGATVQVILPLTKLQSNIAALEERWAAAARGAAPGRGEPT